MRRWMILIVICFVGSPARAQVLDVDVGITPACPYGLSACWGGAEQGLTRMNGIISVTHKPDAANSLAEVKIANGLLPDVAKWSDQFHAIVGQVYAFRGVELVVRGSVMQAANGDLQIQVPGIKDPFLLLPMRHKLQWNYQQAKPKAILPDELAACMNLKTQVDARTGRTFIGRVTGPLVPAATMIGHSVTATAIEVRSFTIEEGRSPTTMPTATTRPSSPLH